MERSRLSRYWATRSTQAYAALLFLGLVITFPDVAKAGTLAACSSNAVTKYGRFDGPIRIELLPDGRLARLIDPVRYTDPCGGVWLSPAGATIDGASIPKMVWSIVGGPFEGKYRDASVIHDIACAEHSRPWQAVHEVFYFAMLASGTPDWQAKVMYAAVYHFGPRWKDPKTHAEPPKSTLSQEDFQALVEAIRVRENGLGVADLPPMSLSEIESWPAASTPKS